MRVLHYCRFDKNILWQRSADIDNLILYKPFVLICSDYCETAVY